MAKSTLTSAPSEIDQQKLKGAIKEAVEPHQENGDHQAAEAAMHEIVARIKQGEFGLPAPPKQSFDVSFAISTSKDFMVTFTWHF